MSHPFVASDRQADFTARMEAEFVVGSGISPLLYRASTRIVWDMEELPGGEVAYPIAEALNWNVTRFGRQARTNQLAILLLQETGDCWQSKFDQARIDLEKGKAIKYESVRGKGSTAFLPAVDIETWAKIAQRNHLGGFLPLWVREAIAVGGERDLANLSGVPVTSHSHALLTGDALESCENRLRSTFATPSRKDISPKQGFSSPTETNTSRNSPPPPEFTNERTPEILSDTTGGTENITSSKSFPVLTGCSPSGGSSPISPLRESAQLQAQFPIETSSFWQWVTLLPIAITLTEGGKKAESLLSQGYVAIALYGVNGG
jgi:hypothetical protein